MRCAEVARFWSRLLFSSLPPSQFHGYFSSFSECPFLCARARQFAMLPEFNLRGSFSIFPNFAFMRSNSTCVVCANFYVTRALIWSAKWICQLLFLSLYFNMRREISSEYANRLCTGIVKIASVRNATNLKIMIHFLDLSRLDKSGLRSLYKKSKFHFQGQVGYFRTK